MPPAPASPNAFERIEDLSWPATDSGLPVFVNGSCSSTITTAPLTNLITLINDPGGVVSVSETGVVIGGDQHDVEIILPDLIAPIPFPVTGRDGKTLADELKITRPIISR